MKALDGGECSTSHPGRFSAVNELPWPFNRRLGGPRVSSIAAQNPVAGNCEHDTKPSACREGEKVSDILSKYYIEKITEFNDVNTLLNPQGTRY